mgnify:CR=1 FL=1
MKKIVLFFTVLFISGCAHEMPYGKGFQSTRQLKLNSASHWDTLAEHEAGMISKTLEFLPNVRVYIKRPAVKVPFAKAYHHLLTSRLAAEGVYIVTEPDFNTAIIKYSVDVIKQPARYEEDRVFETTLAQGVHFLSGTAIAKSIFSVSIAALDVVKVPFYVIGSQNDTFSTPTDEVVVTTQIIMNKQVLNSDSRVYYIENANIPHYTYRIPVPAKKIHTFNVTNQ